MRQFGIALIVGLAAMLGFSSTANAAATVDLIWSGTSGTGATGSSTIAAAAGDTLTLDIMMTAGTEGLSSYGITIAFDSGGLNELNIVGTPQEFGLKATITCTPFPACFFDTPTMTPLSPGVSGTLESTTGSTGFVYTFEAATLGNGAVASFGAFLIGRVQFSVNPSVTSGGPDVVSGLFNVGTDGVFDNASQPVTMNFGGAAVNGPEPGTTLLLGLGLFGLAIAGRRTRD